MCFASRSIFLYEVVDQFRDSILPILLQTLMLKLERTVDLGPFKHKVDDNLSLRKIALSCVETVLDVCPHKIDVPAVMAVLPALLVDKDEIKLQSHQVNIPATGVLLLENQLLRHCAHTLVL